MALRVMVRTKRPPNAGRGMRWRCLIALLLVLGVACMTYAVSILVATQAPTPATTVNVWPGTQATTPRPFVQHTMIPKSKFAYVTLISGIDDSFKYRGFLYNALLMRRSLTEFGSTADFVVMLGFSAVQDRAFFDEDLNLLRAHGIVTYELPRLLNPSIPLGFAEMALLKITPYSFVQYEKVQFFDGDVLPTKNMDCFFALEVDTFTVGVVSPLNSGWFLAIPSTAAYQYFLQKALWRLARDWDQTRGWGLSMPEGMAFRGGKPCTLWDFNGADMDQGLFTQYFILERGGGLLLDSSLRQAKLFAQGLAIAAPSLVPLESAIKCCAGELPTSHFLHFTGRSKPWMRQPGEPGKNTRRWLALLDGLHLPVNSSNIYSHKFGSRLGFFNANFPKGGYRAN